MKVLVITGDKKFKPGHPRYDLQRSAVEELACVYWGRGSMWPKIPEGQFDVVTSQDPFMRGLFAWRVASRKKAKFNVQVHADVNAQSLFRHILAQIVLRHADSVRVVSQKTKEQVERMGVKAKITTLPVFIDVVRFRNVTRQLDESHKTIVWVGRFEKEKNPGEALSVLNTVKNAGIKAGLVMLGTGSLESSLRNAVVTAGYSLRRDDVEFPGWVDPLHYLAKADVVISTSPAESYGASIVEALAAGVPVVAPDVGIAKEAGATVVPRSKLAEAVIDTLRTGARGTLKLPVLTEEEWVQKWKESLI